MQARKTRTNPARPKAGRRERNPLEGVPKFLIRLAGARQIRFAMREDRGRSRHD
jgi:hypothetical protein